MGADARQPRHAPGLREADAETASLETWGYPTDDSVTERIVMAKHTYTTGGYALTLKQRLRRPDRLDRLVGSVAASTEATAPTTSSTA